MSLIYCNKSKPNCLLPEHTTHFLPVNNFSFILFIKFPFANGIAYLFLFLNIFS